ncbi:MAG: MlaD family protein [Planctomycetota bacterium]
MNEQGYRFGVGVLVVASLVIAVILILFFGAAPNLFAERYTVTIRFDAAPGVTTDTPVRKNGVQIGRVKSVELLQDQDGVDLTLELDSQFKVRAQELPQINIGSLITGDAVVEFIPATDASLISRFDGMRGSPQDGVLDDQEKAIASAYLVDREYFPGGVLAPNPLDAFSNIQGDLETALISISGAGEAIKSAGEEVAGVAQKLNSAIPDFEGAVDGQMSEFAKQATTTIDNFNQTLNAIRVVFAGENPQAQQPKISLPDLLRNADQTVIQANNLLGQFQRSTANLESTASNAINRFEQNLSSNTKELTTSAAKAVDRFEGNMSTTLVNEIEELTQPFKDNGESFARNLNGLAMKMNSLAGSIEEITERVNNGRGTLGRLSHDDQLYFSMIRTLSNIEDVTQRLRPIIEDARIFTDKVSRDPSSVIDLQGQLLGRPRGAGLK